MHDKVIDKLLWFSQQVIKISKVDLRHLCMTSSQRKYNIYKTERGNL